MNRRVKTTLMIAAGALALSGCGSSQGASSESAGSESGGNFPTEQIRFVIPYSPGGGTDIIFRTALPYVEEELGQTIVPVNMPGASATLGSREVKDAEPDGYTLLGSHETIINTNLAGVVDYSIEAFEPISLITETPVIAAVGKHTGWENAEEFVEHVKANPGEVTWGITPGSTSHFFAAKMLDKMGLPADALKFVSYVGTTDALAAIQAGDLDGTYADFASAESQFESGAFDSIGVAWDERLEELPKEETFVEQDIDMIYSTARGVYAPAGTPDSVVKTLDKAFKSAVNNPEFQQEIRDLGSVPSYLPHGEYSEFLAEMEAEMTELSKDMSF